MYICTSEFVSFKHIQYSTWCQNRGCILHHFNKENIQIKSSSFLHTFSHTDKKYTSANRINSSRRGEERDSSISSQSLNFNRFQGLQLKFHSVSTCNPVILCKETILHIELILLQKSFKKKYNYKAHPMQAEPRHPSATVPHASKHSTWQKLSWSPYKDSQASSSSTHRNSILSSRQHPHTPYKIPQVHFYRILQEEIGFFSKGLSIALLCSTKVSDFRNSLSNCFLCIELSYKNFLEN